MRGSRTISDHDLGQLLDMTAESLGYDTSDLQVTSQLKRVIGAFEDAVEASLAKGVKALKLSADPDALMDEDGPLNVLLTLEGHGAGIWDGSWDHLFDNPKIEIPKLQKFLEKDLQKWADDTGGGKVPNALMAAVEESGTPMEATQRHAWKDDLTEMAAAGTSQYLGDYLDYNDAQGEGNGATPGSFLNRVLKGKAKQYAGKYQRALQGALDKAVAAGEAVKGTSKGGAVAYYSATKEESLVSQALGSLAEALDEGESLQDIGEELSAERQKANQRYARAMRLVLKARAKGDVRKAQFWQSVAKKAAKEATAAPMAGGLAKRAIAARRSK